VTLCPAIGAIAIAADSRLRKSRGNSSMAPMVVMPMEWRKPLIFPGWNSTSFHPRLGPRKNLEPRPPAARTAPVNWQRGPLLVGVSSAIVLKILNRRDFQQLPLADKLSTLCHKKSLVTESSTRQCCL